MKVVRAGRGWLGLQSIAAAIGVAGLLLCSAGTVRAQTTLTYTGAVQTYIVPPGAIGITIQARGAGGGGAGSDGQPNTDGGAGGAGAQASGTYPVTAGTTLNVFVGGAGGSAQSNEGNTGNSCASTAGSAGVASGGYSGGAGSTAGCSPYSGGGGGGGAASGVALGATPILIAGGGSGGQGGSLGGNGVGGLASSATGAIASPSAGQNGSAPGSDGGGGGGGGGGCPGGVGGLFKPDNNPPNPNTPAGAGSSCRAASVTGFSVTGGGGGAGGAGAIAYNWSREVASGARSGTSGQVVITPIYPLLSVVKVQGITPMLIDNNNYYDLTVTNTATVAAASATVQDQLPPGMTYVNSFGSATGWSCVAGTPDGNGTLVTCTFVGTIAVSGGTTLLRINVTPTTSSTKTNRASIDRTGGIAPPAALTCTAVNTPSQGCAAPVVSTMVELTISKSQPSPALQVGSNSTYTITVNNFGSSVATTARFRDQLPASLEFVSAAGSGWTCGASPPGGGALVTCDFAGSVASGANLPTVALVVRPTLNQNVTNFLAVAPRGGTGVPISTTCTAQGVPDRGCGAPVVSLTDGSQLSGVVFRDTGIGGGTANNGVRDGGEVGVAGVLVEIRNGSTVVASTTTSGDGSYTLFVPGPPGSRVVTPVLPSGFLATGGSHGTTGGSYTRPSVSYTTVSGSAFTGANFGIIPPNSFIANGAQSTAPGTMVFYTHTYNPGSAGSVTFALSALATPVITGWTQVLYLDSNCNAAFDAGEPQITSPITATAGVPICLIVRQQTPPGASLGAQNTITVTANMAYSNASPALNAPTLTVTDTTTIAASGGIVLAKLVRNITTGGALSTAINALPGQTMEYTVTATNNGSQPVSTIVINDATPGFTNFVSAACPLPAAFPAGITACTVSIQPAAGASGAVQWMLTGSLTPTAQIAVRFQIKVDQ